MSDLSATPAPVTRPFGNATREIECQTVVVYNDRVLAEAAFAKLQDVLFLDAVGSKVEPLELYTIIQPCRVLYRAGTVRVHQEFDPTGVEVFSIIDEQSNALLFFTPKTPE